MKKDAFLISEKCPIAEDRYQLMITKIKAYDS
jgi:hypothetical protein